MPAERVAMRQAREIIRLKFSALVFRPARSHGGSASRPRPCRETLRRFESAGLSWPLPDDMTDGKLGGGALRQSRNANRATGATPSRIGRRFIGS